MDPLAQTQQREQPCSGTGDQRTANDDNQEAFAQRVLHAMIKMSNAMRREGTAPSLQVVPWTDREAQEPSSI